MKAEQLKKVVEKHKKYLDINSRTCLEEMIYLTEDLLEEEIKYLEESEPQATVTISDTKKAREIIRGLYHSIDNMDTGELVKHNIWTD